MILSLMSKENIRLTSPKGRVIIVTSYRADDRKIEPSRLNLRSPVVRSKQRDFPHRETSSFAVQREPIADVLKLPYDMTTDMQCTL